MNNLKNDLIVAFQEGNFLKVLYDKSLSERDGGKDIAEELVRMHNDGLIDVIAGFKALRNKAGAGYDFFLIRHVLERALPHLNAPVRSLMECVLQLVNEAGQDLAAGRLFTPFIEFCAVDPSRPKEALKQIEASIDQLADLLSPTIVAGARIDITHYLNEAIRLASHENLEIRKRAIFSLGEIQFTSNHNLCESALVCLEISVSKETDDLLLANLIHSAFSLYKCDKSKQERIITLINKALLKGDKYVLHTASVLFCLNFEEIPEALLDNLLDHLRLVSPKNKGTIDMIDCGLDKLLDQEYQTKAIEFIENILIANPNDLSLDIFDSVNHKLLNNEKNVLNRLLTRWFLRGDRVLCEGIRSILEHAYNKDVFLSIEPSELSVFDTVHILFIARKAAGYLFQKPVTAASIIISLIQIASDDETIQYLCDLLFDPLLINYPGKVKEYLCLKAGSDDKKVKRAAEITLKTFDDYLSDLKSCREIRELHPPQTQRDAYNQFFSQLVYKSFKETESKSILADIAAKSVLLYGRKSINYVYGHNGKSNRMEIPLHSIGTEMEFPRIEHIDPFGLEQMLLIFRAERMIK